MLGERCLHTQEHSWIVSQTTFRSDNKSVTEETEQSKENNMAGRFLICETFSNP